MKSGTQKVTLSHHNQALWSLWNNAPESEINERLPFFQDQLTEGALLFVGINPSFSEKGIDQILAQIKNPDIPSANFFKFPPKDSFNLEKVVELTSVFETAAREFYPYFSPFKKIAGELGFEQQWAHIDLFAIRETSQKRLERMIYRKKPELNTTAEKQLALSVQLIQAGKPAVVVVANALASHILKAHLRLKFDKAVGYHTHDFNGRRTPIFLGSMLSGQRALDTHSYERLRWHLAQAVSRLR